MAPQPHTTQRTSSGRKHEAKKSGGAAGPELRRAVEMNYFVTQGVAKFNLEQEHEVRF